METGNDLVSEADTKENLRKTTDDYESRGEVTRTNRRQKAECSVRADKTTDVVHTRLAKSCKSV